jgi:hypothetical protein
LVREAALWFRDLEVGSISSWIDFYCAFLKYWGENKSLDQYLADFNALRRGEEEAMVVFNKRFYSVYHSMPLEIRPSEATSMVYYVMAQHSELVLLLRERKSSSLRHLFEDAEEVEKNIQACKRIREQTYFENMHAHEQQKECKYESDLGQHLTVSSKFSDFSMDWDVHHAYVHFQNQFEHAVVDDCIDNYMFLVDHSQNALSPAMKLSYDHVYEEETAILDDQELLVKAQGGHLFLSKGEFKQWKSSFLNQQFCDYGFEDPVAALLESYLSDSLTFSDFIISPTLIGEHDSLKEFQSLLSYLCYSLLISGRDEIISVLNYLNGCCGNLPLPDQIGDLVRGRVV